ncbi:MAG: galactose-1-phosphate uridylyltransferase [Candidatus Doudnabacteria bacterium]
MSQFRQNPISKHWVLIAPNRSKRPEQFAREPVISQNMPEIIPACVFCPGNESKNDDISRFPKGKNWEIRVIPNKFEALSDVPLTADKEFYISRSGTGDHEVVITRKHNEPIALQSTTTVVNTIKVLQQRYLELAKHQNLAYVQIFYNHGREAGASLIHPHFQIISTPFVPHNVHEEILGCYHYYRAHNKCIYCAIIEEERKQNERVMYETEDFIVLAPYASRSPFETWILPRKHGSNFEEITEKETIQLANVLKMVLGRLYTKLSDPPLNFYIHTMPLQHATHSAYKKETFHWHLVIFPRIAIWAGFEYATGIPINPMPPEDAVKFLK